jgi:hypothetical protein
MKQKQSNKLTPAKFTAGLKRLLLVSKAELDTRLQRDREQRRARRQAQQERKNERPK